MRSRASLLLAALLATGCASRPGAPASAAPAAPEPPPPPDVGPLSPEDAPISLRKSAVATEWFWLRAKTVEGNAPMGFEEATAAMAALKETIGPDAIVWEDLEVAVLGVARAQELPSAVGGLPSLEDDPTRVTQLRLAALRAARAAAATEGHYRRAIYPEHEREIAGAAQTLSRMLLPRADAVLAEMRADLGATWPSLPVVLTLVYDGPFRGSEAPGQGGRALGRFIRVRGAVGGTLVASALTEILLGFDEQATPDDASALQKLRAALVRRGLGKDDPEIELATHALAAAEARALVQRMQDAPVEPASCGLFPAGCAIDEAWTKRPKDASVDATVEVLARAVAPGS